MQPPTPPSYALPGPEVVLVPGLSLKLLEEEMTHLKTVLWWVRG
jgi:hypothetical protein